MIQQLSLINSWAALLSISYGRTDFSNNLLFVVDNKRRIKIKY